MIALARESAKLQKEVLDRFDEMRDRYRAAHPQLVSREAWAQIFEPGSDLAAGAAGSAAAGSAAAGAAGSTAGTSSTTEAGAQ